MIKFYIFVLESLNNIDFTLRFSYNMIEFVNSMLKFLKNRYKII